MGHNAGRRLPDAVLFCCNFNQVRSPMAEALLKRIMGNRIFVDSCGLKRGTFNPDVDDMEVDPLAAEVMKELGADLTRHRCKTFAELEDDSFDLVISLTPEAQHRAVELARGRSADIEYWPTQDPTLTEGSRQHRLEAYRQVRDGLAARIRKRFGA
ncbi:MAG TPA: low molecular weight phosphatase family protein [Phenylobacterium sp.]|nr:low molecular weight phosphatase family protein [Phenylobacterium sp.]